MKPGIYVHLPFCAVRCTYCDFPLTTRRGLADAYYDCLLREIGMAPAPSADTLYFGGGTPSLTPPEILKQIRSCFSLEAGAEITLEANPDDVTLEKVQSWKAAGFTRLSIGVQSLESIALQIMLRQHTAEQAVQALSLAQAADLASVNADLIIGSPGQTTDGFLRGLEQLIKVGPQHFSLYFLEVHEKTALASQIANGRTMPMGEEDQLDCYLEGSRMLENAGYNHYEVSNFARAGFESRHNLKYWNAMPYHAYGAGACSYHDSLRTKNVSSIPEYIRLLQAGTLPIESSEMEDSETRMRNALIFGLRKREGLDAQMFEQDYGTTPMALFQNGQELVDAGLLETTQGRLRLTLRGMLLSNDVLSRAV